MWYKVKHLTLKNKLQCKLVYYYLFLFEKCAFFVWSFKQKNIFLCSHIWFLRKKSYYQLTPQTLYNPIPQHDRRILVRQTKKICRKYLQFSEKTVSLHSQ